MKRFPIYCILLCLVSACAVGPNFQKPVTPLPKSYRYADTKSVGDSIVNLDWWKLFNDAQLDSLISEALRNNKDIAIAYSRIKQARYELGSSRADLWPAVGYIGEAGHFSPSTRSGNKDYDQFSLSGNINWEIDIWGKLRRTNEAAREQLFSTEEVYNGIYLSLITEIASNYFILRDFDNKLEISKQTLKSRQEYFDIINERYLKGVAPEWDLRQAEVQVSGAAAAIPVFERGIAETESVLTVLVGRNPGAIPRGKGIYEQTVNPAIPPGLPSQLLDRRPDILASQHLLAAQTARIGIAQAMRLPSLSLTGLFGIASGDLTTLVEGQSFAWNATAGLLGPVFAFNKNKRRVDIEKEKTYQALKTYEQTVLNAFTEVENSLVDIKTYNDELTALENQAKAAQRVVDLSRKRYDAGVTSYLEVLDADRTNFEVQLTASEMKQKSLLSQINLYKTLGGGWNVNKPSAR